MTMLRQTAIILAVISLLQLATLISFVSGEVIPAINLTCPKYFSEEAMEKVNCSVNTTQFSASSCLVYPTTVDFFFQNDSFILLCSAPYNGKCDEEPVGEMNCSCVESDDGVNIYQLNFLGNKTVYEGASLTCNVECYSSVPFASLSSCTSLKYEEPETTPPSTPIETTGTSSTTTTTAVKSVSTEISTVTTSITRKTTNAKQKDD